MIIYLLDNRCSIVFQFPILRNEEGQRSRDLVRVEAVVLARPYAEQGVPPHLHVLLAHPLGRADPQQRSYEFHRVRTICPSINNLILYERSVHF